MPLLGRHYRLRRVFLTVSKIRKADKEQPPDNVATSTICGQYSPLYVSVGQPTLADATARNAFGNAGPVTIDMANLGGNCSKLVHRGLRGLHCLGLKDSEDYRRLAGAKTILEKIHFSGIASPD